MKFPVTPHCQRGELKSPFLKGGFRGISNVMITSISLNMNWYEFSAIFEALII
jgi:hypothetical protein